MTQLHRAEFQVQPEEGNPFICSLIYATKIMDIANLEAILRSQIIFKYNAPSVHIEVICKNQSHEFDKYLIDMRLDQPRLSLNPFQIRLVDDCGEEINRYNAYWHTNEEPNQYDKNFISKEIVLTIPVNRNPNGFASVDYFLS